MGKDYGEPIRYNPDFNGPIHNRSCTDIIWLIVFILFLGAWGYVGYYSITHGDVEKLLAPIDSKGRRCGLDSGLENKKYLVFFDISRCLSPGTPIVGCPTPQVCVDQCPSSTVLFDAQLTQDTFSQLKSSMVCTDEVDTQTMTYSQAKEHINNGRCARYVLNSQPVLFRCIGDLSTLQCKDKSPTPSSKWVQTDESCVRNPKEAQKSLLNSATALDSYVGWIMASWATYFTSSASERDTYVMNHITNLVIVHVSVIGAVLGRCFVDVTDLIKIIDKITNSTELLELTEEQVLQQFTNLIKLQELSSQIVQDLVQSRWYMLGALVCVVIICFLYILLLRWVVAPVVWTSIVGLIALLGFCLYLCYKNYVYYKANPGTMYQTTNLKGYAQSLFGKHTTWLVILIILAIFLAILLMMVIFLRNRITIAIALIREGSKAVGAIKSTIFFPIFPWILQCFVIAYGVLVLMYLLSIGDPAFTVVNLQNDTTCDCQGKYVKDGVPCNPAEFYTSCFDTSFTTSLRQCQQATCHFTGIDNPHNVIYMHLANLLGFFWMMAFIGGVADMMLASTFSTWYWTFQKRDLPFFTLTSGIYRTIRYHLGTVAFGSLIIAIVQVIRVILEYIDHKLKKFDNPFTRCILCCCKCFFWCLENFIKFINKNAYIMCAVHGKNFCSSARDAFSLLMRNIVRVVVLDKVMDFIFFLSKLLISIGVGVAVYYLLEWNFVYEVTKGERLHYNYVPAIILSIATYLISTIFFNVYAMAVDTLFLCFLEDCERNDGSPEKPYFMSTNLMKILGKKNKRA